MNARGERGSGVWSGVVMRVNSAARKIGAESGCGARVNDGALESKLLSLADGGGARGESGEGWVGAPFRGSNASPSVCGEGRRSGWSTHRERSMRVAHGAVGRVPRKGCTPLGGYSLTREWR